MPSIEDKLNFGVLILHRVIGIFAPIRIYIIFPTLTAGPWRARHDDLVWLEVPLFVSKGHDFPSSKTLIAKLEDVELFVEYSYGGTAFLNKDIFKKN